MVANKEANLDFGTRAGLAKETILNVLTPLVKRAMLGFEITKTSKFSSSLQVLKNTETGEEFVNNRRLSEENVVSWELLHSHIAELFPAKVQKKIFGVFKGPQVAPIIEDAEGYNRTYYRGSNSSVYGELAGLSTHQFAEMLHIDDTYIKYKNDKWSNEKKWLATVTTLWMEDTLREDPPSISQEKKEELENGYDLFWHEFNECNSNKKSRYVEQIELQENSYTASIALVEASHRICDTLRIIYAAIDSKEDSKLKDLILFQLHLQQGITQQVLLWWLGINHGHLHPGNLTVLPNTDETIDTPIITSVIDFDKSYVNQYKIANNDELYESVDPDVLIKKIFDLENPLQVRLNLILYLPLEHWNQEIINLVDEQDYRFRSIVCHVIEVRLAKDVKNSEQFILLATYAYSKIKELDPKRMEYGVRLEDLVSSIRQRPDLILQASETHSVDRDLIVLSNYFLNGLAALNIDELLERQLLLVINQLGVRNEDSLRTKYSNSEVEFINLFRKRTDEVGKRANQILAYINRYSS